MALDPLKFAVAIKDEATGQLNKIQSELEKLKDKTLTIKVEGLSELKSLLETLKGGTPTSNVGEKMAQDVDKATAALKKEREELARLKQDQTTFTPKEIGSIAKSAVIEELKKSLGYIAEAKEAIKNDSFTAFSNRVNKAAESINNLTAALQKFNAEIGNKSGLNNYMAGLSEMLAGVSAAMSAINNAKNGTKGGGRSNAQKEELKQQEEGLVKVADALGRVRSAAVGNGGSIPFMESITRVGERNIQTLIKEQGHIERLIEIAKKSITFGEGHPVLGMGRLRGDQMFNLKELEALKKTINEILYLANSGDQAAIRFLNTIGALKTTPFGKDAMGNDITLLGGHFDKLTHSVTGTSTAMRQLHKEMRLDSNVWPNAEQESNQRRYNQMLADAEKLLRRIDEAGAKGFKLGLDTSLTRVGSRDISDFIDKVLKFNDVGNFRALNELIGQFQRLKSLYGEVAKEQERLNTQTENSRMKSAAATARDAKKESEAMARSMRDAETEALRITKIIQRLTALRAQADGKTSVAGIDNLIQKLSILKRDYESIVSNNGKTLGGALFGDLKNQPNVRDIFFGIGDVFSEANKGIRQYEQAQKSLQHELDATERKITQVKAAIDRGNNAGRDMTGLQNALSVLEGKKNLAAMSTPNDTRFKTRLDELRAEREAIEALRKAEEKLNTEREQANKRSNNEAVKNLEREAESVNRAVVEYNKLGVKLNELYEYQHRGSIANLNTSAIDQYIARLELAQKVLQEIWSNNGRTGTGAAVSAMGLSKGLLASEVLKHNNYVGQTMFDEAGFKKYKQELLAMERQMNAAKNTAMNLGEYITQMSNKGVSFKNLDTTAFDTALQKIKDIQAELARFAQTGQSAFGSTSREIVTNMGLRTAKTELADATRNLERKQREAAQATAQMSSEQQRLSQALNHTNEQMRGQSQILSDLKSLATQYLGVWGGQQFLHNIIEIGGQLEMQRLSIGSILQNQAQANTLFNQIKGLATQSPFGVVQLDQMTKQLTAYGFKYHELYDMTKRLADISAATGTEVSRLALALGHVRSEAALSGYTLRQFSMGNVPLLQKLSEKLGKTTKEIREMVKAKEISYDDVLGVLKDLTNEGGMFYNMQEVISQSVKAKFKNVKDAMDIMYGEMAEGDIGDALKGVADVLMEVTRNWKDFATILVTSGAVWAAQRARILSYNYALGQNTAALSANILAYKRKRAAELTNEAMVRKLTAEELALVATRKQITAANLQVAISSGAVTKGEALKMIALRKVSIEEAKALVRMGAFTAAEVRMALQGRVLGLQLGKTGAMMKLFAERAKTSTMALLSNKGMWVMAAITAIIELWQRNSREMEKAEEIADNIYQHSQDAIKNTRSMMQSELAPISIVGQDGKDIKTADLGFNNIGNAKLKFPEVDMGDMKQVMDQWTDYIKNYAANAGQILNKANLDAAGNILPLEERFNNLKKAIDSVALAQYALQDIGDVFSNAAQSTDGGWFDDNVLTDIGNYDKKLRKFSSNVASAYRKYRQAIDNGIKAAERQSKSFADATKGMDTYAQKFDYLVKNQTEFAKAWSAFSTSEGTGSAVGDLNNAIFSTTTGDVNSAKQEMQSELDSYYAQVEAELETKGVNIKKLSEAQQQALLIGYKKQLESVQGLSQETMNYLMKAFAQHFGIELDLNDEKFIPKVNEATETLNNLVEGDWKVDLDFVEHINDAIDEARKKYKLAKEYFEKTEQIRLKFGIDLKMGQIMDEKTKKSILSKIENEDIRKEVEKVINGLNQASAAFNKSTEASKNLGFSLEDDKKKSKSKTDKKNKGSQKDPEAERLRKIIKVLKEAADSYQYWRKAVGDGSAFGHVEEEFGKLLKELGLNVNDADKLKKKFESLREEFGKKPKTKQMIEALRELDKEISGLNRKDFEKSVEDASSKMKKNLVDLTRRWEIFNSVREATGDKTLAADLAGIGMFERNNYRNAADNMIESISEAMRDAGADAIIDFDKVVEMSDTEIEDYVKKLLGGSKEYENQIKAISDALKEWQKLEKDAIKGDIDMYAKLIGSMTSYGAQLKKNNNEFERYKTGLDNQLLRGDITQSQYEEALRIAQTQRDTKNWKLSSTYLNLMNGANSLARGEVLDAVERAVEGLKEQMEAGLITTQEYAEELAKLKKIQADWDDNALFGKNNAMTNFIQKGLPGLKQYLETARNNAERNGDEKTVEKLDKQIKAIDTAANALGDLAVVIDMVIGALDGMQKAATALSNVFDALGHTGSANTWSDISDGIGAVSSFFTPANGLIQSAMSGNIGGLVSSAISAPFQMIASPIEGFAKLHDKRRERQIENIRKDIQKIDNTLNLIRTTRGKTLGYDDGAYRRMMAAMYANDKSRSGKAMYEYYSRGGLDVSGYQQELDALKKQREEYAKMYDKEKSKKKESKEALEEYKQKMAELDMQIKDYSIELANELWSIDLKGWADQIGDALMNAFENGTSAAIAFQDATRSIMQSVVSEMLKVGFMQPMLERLKERLFGEDGAFDPMNPEKSMGAVLSELGRFFGEGGEGSKMIGAAGEFLSGAEELLNKNFGMSLKSNSSSTSQTNGIQSQATEESIGIVSGQLARIAQDVSVKRIFLTQFVTNQMPSMLDKVEQQRVLLDNQFQSVRAIQSMMQDGSGAMYDAIYRMSTKIDRAITPEGRVQIQ